MSLSICCGSRTADSLCALEPSYIRSRLERPRFRPGRMSGSLAWPAVSVERNSRRDTESRLWPLLAPSSEQPRHITTHFVLTPAG